MLARAVSPFRGMERTGVSAGAGSHGQSYRLHALRKRPLSMQGSSSRAQKGLHVLLLVPR